MKRLFGYIGIGLLTVYFLLLIAEAGLGHSGWGTLTLNKVLSSASTWTSVQTHSADIKINDDTDLIYGTDSDVQVRYDEATDNRLEWHDGTNTLMSLADAGTTGNLNVTGNATLSGDVGFGGATSPQHDISVYGATPIIAVTDSDVNLNTSTAGQAGDTASIVIGADLTNPWIEFTDETGDGSVIDWDGRYFTIHAENSAEARILIEPSTASGDASIEINDDSGNADIFFKAENTSYIRGGALAIGATGTASTNGTNMLVLGQSVGAPSGMPSNTAGIYAIDVSGTAELYAIDEAGNNVLLTGSTTGNDYSTIGFADSSVTLALTQNTYAFVTNGTKNLFTNGVNNGFTQTGDSIQVPTTGDYEIIWDLSYSGANTDVYEIGVSVNGAVQASAGRTQRGMSGTDEGVSGATTILSLTADDWVALKIQNTANNNDATVIAGNFTIHGL